MYKTTIHPGTVFIGTVYSYGNKTGSIFPPFPYVDYINSYCIAPLKEKQILDTRDKHLLNDFVIYPISCYEYINKYGGETCIVGHDVRSNTSSVSGIAVSGLAVIGRRIINWVWIK